MIAIRKTNHKWNQHPTFINRSFLTRKRTTIIRKPDYNRILPFTRCLQFIYQHLELPVHLVNITIHHRHIMTNHLVVRIIRRNLYLIRRYDQWFIRAYPHLTFMRHIQVENREKRHSFWGIFPMSVLPLLIPSCQRRSKLIVCLRVIRAIIASRTQILRIAFHPSR